VMEKTPHKLLVGEGAERFAAREGFKPAQLLTQRAKQKWEDWKRSGEYRDFHVGEKDDSHDTIGVLGIDASGAIGVACSTSGRAFKLPGRVGDSPLVGSGIYCDPAVGVAVATGTGELMIGTCASFLVVERMRGGERPIDAIRYVLRRVAESYPALGEKDQCALIALAPDGHYASGALRAGFQVAVTTKAGGQLLPPDVVLL
jgi:N4-(beta-N-acetylglucosaminyl)-L-asparaginase